MPPNKLSQLDKRVLSHISLNGASSVREMAAKLRISPSTLSYRMRRLEQSRAILDYRYRVDFSQLGFSQEAWIFLDLKHTGINISSVVDRLLLMPEVHIALVITGDFDVALKLYGRSIDDISHFMMGLEQDFRDAIRASSICLVMRKLKTHNTAIGQKKIRPQFSSTDFRLLSYRMEHPKATVGEIASELMLHRNTVATRWRRLFSDGIILKKTAVLNPEHYAAVGIGFTALTFFNATPGNKKKLADALLEMDEIHELSLVAFPHDILAVIRTADIDSYYEFHKRFFPPSTLNHLISHVKSFVIMHSKTHPPSYLRELGEAAVVFPAGRNSNGNSTNQK